MKKIFTLLCLTFLVLQSYAITWQSGYGYFEVNASSDCAPVTASFTNFNYPGAVSYQWDFGDGSPINTTFSPNHVYANSGTKLVILRFFNSGGSNIMTDYAYVDLVGNPGSISTQQTSACINDYVQFNIDYPNINYSQYTFTWNYGDGNTEVTNYNNVQHQFSAPGNYTITCTINSPCGNYNVSYPNFTVGTNLPFSGGYFEAGYAPVCPGDPVYMYYYGAANAFIQFGDGTYANNAYQHVYNAPGTYIVRATLYNGCGNSAIFTDTVYVQNNLGFNPNNPPYAYNSSPICPGQNVYFDTPSNYASAVWNFSDGSSYSGFYVDKVINATQNDTAFVTITNGCGRDTTIMSVVTVEMNLPVDDIDLWMPPSACTGSPIQFSANGLDEPNYSNTYSWNFGDGNSANTMSGYHTYAANGTYNVTLTVSNLCGMDSTQTQTVTVGAGVAPDPNYSFLFIAPEDGICAGDSALFVVFPYVPGNYLFDFGDGTTSTNYNIINIFGREYLYTKHPFQQSGNYNVQMTYTNNCGLSMTKNTTYLVGSNVSTSGDIFFDESKPICLGDPILFYGMGGSKYTWDFGDGTGTFVSTSTFVPIGHVYQNPGVYTVVCKIENGCGNFEILTDFITVPDNRLNVSTNTVNANCLQENGKAIAVITGGTQPYSITWSSGGNGIIEDSLSSGIYLVHVTDKNGCYNFGVATVSDDEAPALIVNNVLDVSCYGGHNGAIDINVIGSSAPYSYQWSNGLTSDDISNLSAGPYEIIVTDANGCKAVKSVLVDQPDQFIVSHNTTNASCGSSNGIIQVNVVGTTGPYIYAWNSGHSGATFYNRPFGLYTVNVIDANGCIVTQTIPVGEENALGGPAIVLNSISDLDCNGAGSTIDISVYQPSTNLTYLWNTGATTQDITVNAPGNYYVSVTDPSGCRGLGYYTVNQAKPEAQSICLVTVDSLYSVNKVVWEKAASTDIAAYKIYRESSQNGLYYHIGTVPYDSLSVFTDYVANPMVTAWRYRISAVDFCGKESDLSGIHKTIHLNQNIGVGGVVNLIWDHYNGFQFPTYEIIRYTTATGWVNIGSVSASNTSFTDPSPPSDPSLFYVIESTPGFVCTATRAENHNSTRSNRSTNAVAPPNSVSEVIGSIEGMNLYPNPSNGQFNLEIDFVRSDNANLEIFNLSGQLIYTTQINHNGGRFRTQISLDDITPGIYLVKLNSESSSFVKKLVINK